MTIDEIRKWLDPEEPNYQEAASNLGKEALPALQSLIHGTDTLLSAKAIYLSSLIGGENALGILRESANHPDPSIRVAVAFSMRNLREQDYISLLPTLSKDLDSGVRKAAIQSIPKINKPVLEILKDLKVREQNPGLRKIINQRLKEK